MASGSPHRPKVSKGVQPQPSLRARATACALVTALALLPPSFGCTLVVHKRWRGEGYPSDLSVRLDRATPQEVELDATLLHEHDELRRFRLRFDPAREKCSSPIVTLPGAGRLNVGESRIVPIEVPELLSSFSHPPACEVALDYTALEGRGGVSLEAITASGRPLQVELHAPHRHGWLIAYPFAAVVDVAVGAVVVAFVVPLGICYAAGRNCIGWLDGKTFSP